MTDRQHVHADIFSPIALVTVNILLCTHAAQKGTQTKCHQHCQSN